MNYYKDTWIRRSALVLFCSLAFGFGKVNAQKDFYAYHTNITHTSTDYFGKYADLIVVMGQGKQLEFSRRTQYLPKWVTPKGSFLMDDFYPGRDFDHQFNYNYVRLLESSDEKIVVHWRYVPDIDPINKANSDLNPTFLDGFTSSVHETFTIYPDRKIEREVKDARGSVSDNWNKPDYGDKQILQLKDNGIEHGKVVWGNKSIPPPKYIVKNPLTKPRNSTKPVMSWTFDEGGGDYPDEIAEDIQDMLKWEPATVIGKTFESVQNGVNQVLGHGSVYKKGVSGTALAFDGYYTGVQVEDVTAQAGSTYFEEEGIPAFEEQMTIEAWVALDVYPYNIAPIIHQSEGFGEKGYYLGIDAYGKVLFTVEGQTIIADETLPLYTWTHVAGVIGDDTMSIYVDGKVIKSSSFEGKITKPKTPLMIGLNIEEERCTDYVRGPMQNIPFIYGIQGLLDEVKLYGTALSSDQLRVSFDTFLPEDRKSPLMKAILPGEVGVAEEFGAQYKNLQHHELWDNMWRLHDKTDIVVKFDNNPGSVVYWRGTNFAANWVTDNNRWMADQSSEIFTKHGCAEHMADKQTRHSYARIIENNDARVVIHWRYPCVDVGYICMDKRNWTDEYHTIYPDGTAVRKVIFNNASPPGFQDIQFFTNPGEAALDVVHLDAMTVANLKGETQKLTWKKPNKNPQIKIKDPTIEWLNSKSDWKVFTVFQGPGISTWGEFEQSKYTDDPFAGPWNHWPISVLPSDGRYAVAHDRVTHFALGANDLAPEHGAMVHYGFTDESIEYVIPIARYWQNPPKISSTKGIDTAVFNKDEKAFMLKLESSDMASVRIDASSESPLINPAFVLKNCDYKDFNTLVNGKKLPLGKTQKRGVSYDENGEPFYIVWLRAEYFKSTTIEFVPIDN